MNHIHTTRLVRVAGIAAVIMIVGAATFAYRSVKTNESRAVAFAHAIISASTTGEMVTAYRDLLDSAGATNAQRILAQSGMPRNGTTHLINHETGYYLYETEGAAGINGCETYFEEACFHGFLISYITDRGIAEIPALVETCTNLAATQNGQQLQCAHGLGHAFRVYVGYEDLPRALSLCTETYSDERSRMFCMQGVFMQNVIDEPTGSGRWHSADPQKPCTSRAVREFPGADIDCFGMQSQFTLSERTYPAFAGDASRVFAYCSALVKEWSDICMLGLSDQILLSSENNVVRVKEDCAAFGSQSKLCVSETVSRAYQYGDHTYPLAMCTSLPGEDVSWCHQSIFFGIRIAHGEASDQRQACTIFKDRDVRNECIEWLRDAPQTNPAILI